MKMKNYRFLAGLGLTQWQRYLWDLASQQDTVVNYIMPHKEQWIAFRGNEVICNHSFKKFDNRSGKKDYSLTAYFKHHQPYEGLVEILDAPADRPWEIYCMPTRKLASNLIVQTPLGPRLSYYKYDDEWTGYVRHIRIER